MHTHLSTDWEIENNKGLAYFDKGHSVRFHDTESAARRLHRHCSARLDAYSAHLDKTTSPADESRRLHMMSSALSAPRLFIPAAASCISMAIDGQ